MIVQTRSLDANAAPEALMQLARAVVRLCPDRRDPERFHADKSDIAAALRALARELGRAA